MKLTIFLLIFLFFGLITAEQQISFGDSISVEVVRANSFNYNYLLILVIGVIFGIFYYLNKRKNKDKEVIYE